MPEGTALEIPEPTSYSAPVLSPTRVSPSNRALMVLALLVIILFGAGMVALQARSLFEPPPYNSPEYATYLQNLRRITFTSAVLLDAGVAVLLVTVIVVAVKRDDVPDAVRRGLLILATVVTALWLFAAFFSTSSIFP